MHGRYFEKRRPSRNAPELACVPATLEAVKILRALQAAAFSCCTYMFTFMRLLNFVVLKN